MKLVGHERLMSDQHTSIMMQMNVITLSDTHTERDRQLAHRHKHTDRQTDRQTHKHTDRQYAISTA